MRPASRAFIIVAATITLCLIGSNQVRAETELGDFCWGFSDFGDVNRLTLLQADNAPDTFIAAHGRWQFPVAAPIYQLEVTGHVSLDNVAGGGNLALRITGSHMTTFFGNDQNCSLNASLNGVTLNGSYSVVCSPGPGIAPFTANFGTLVSIACPAGAAPQGRTGPGVGEAQRQVG